VIPPAQSANSGRPDASIVIGTKNRAASLDRTLHSVMALNYAGSFEVIVVDNDSTDDTRTRIEQWSARSAGRVRYLLETRPGASHARNAGIAAARAPIVAFVDDDEELPPEWLQIAHDALAENADVEMVGGPLRPIWETPPPAWLQGRELGGVVSLVDGGGQAFVISAERWFCFAAGNMAARRETLDRLRGFDPSYRRSEDRELLVRFLLAGGKAKFEPSMIAFHHIVGHRLTRAYYRWWYSMEGAMRGGFAFDELFLTGAAMCPLPADAPRVLGVAPAIYKQLFRSGGRWAGAMLRWRYDAAFRHELQVRYFWHYLGRRHHDQVGASASARIRGFAADATALLRMKLRRGHR
jgi:glucosyl-dolichyl phosphate glucuronosyltransferase